MLYLANQGSKNPEARAYHLLFQVSPIMANPDITAKYDSGIPHRNNSGKPFVYLDRQFPQRFHALDDAIRHDKLEKLLQHVQSLTWEAAHVNLSEDPLLSVVIAYEKSKLAIELIEQMPPMNLIIGNFNGDTALHVAVAKGDESVVDALVKQSDDLLHLCNKAGHLLASLCISTRMQRI